MRTIVVELDNIIKYSNGSGVEVDGNFVEIEEPTGKVAHLVGIIKSEIGKATKKSFSELSEEKITAAKNAKEDKEEDEDTDPEAIGESGYTMLVVGGADMTKVFSAFKEILRASAKVGSEKAFTDPMYNRMTFSDLERCLRSYIGNFMQAS